MLFTFLGKIVATLSIIAGIAVCVGLAAEFNRPGQAAIDPSNPVMLPLLAGGAMALSLITFGLLLGVFCEISSNIRRIKLTA